MTPTDATVTPPCDTRWNLASRQGVAAAVLLATISASMLLTMAGCSYQTEVLQEDKANKRTVELITGADPAAPPPVEAFQSLTGHQLEASLGRITVEPSTWARFVRENPTHLLTKEQRDWIVEHLMPRLSTLKPDQRLRFSFPDRFKGKLVELEVFPQGETLVYRFTQLAADKEDLETTVGQKVANWVTLVTIPGQTLEEDLRAFTLTDPVTSDNPNRLAQRTENLEILRLALELNKIQPDEGARLGAMVEKRDDLSPENLREYLKKRETLAKALEQEIFTKAEFDQRREQLLTNLEP